MNISTESVLSSDSTMCASAALLQRPLSAEAQREQTAQLAIPLPNTCNSDVRSVLVFRLGKEWFALPAGLCRQVLSPLPAHTLPHRSNATLLGVVNVRGQMLLKVSFLEVLGLGAAISQEAHKDNSLATKVYPRMVVIEKALSGKACSELGSDIWVFEVDELDGIHPIELAVLESPAVGVQSSAYSCTQQVFLWQDRRVSLLDDTRLFDALRQRAL